MNKYERSKELMDNLIAYYNANKKVKDDPDLKMLWDKLFEYSMTEFPAPDMSIVEEQVKIVYTTNNPLENPDLHESYWPFAITKLLIRDGGIRFPHSGDHTDEFIKRYIPVINTLYK
jgi:hypothetical protein